MINSLLKTAGGTLSIIVFILLVVVLMYTSYLLAIGLVISLIGYTFFSTLETFRKTK